MARQLKRAVTFWTDAGGVGKTTMTSNVGDVLASRGNNVLCMDLDPQHGGLTKFIGMEDVRNSEEFNLLNVIFDDERTLEDIIVPGEKIGLSYDLVPSHEEGLEKFAKEITAKYEGNPLMVIRRLLWEADLADQYDYILIDVQGSRAELVANAIIATRNVISPIELSEKGAGSIDKLESYIERQESTLNQELQAIGGNKASLNIIGVVPYGLSHGTGNFQTLQNDEKDGVYDLHLNGYPVTPFGVPKAGVVSDSLSRQMTLREFIGDDETRDLRSSSCEQVIMSRFEALADLVEAGNVTGLSGPYTTATVFDEYSGDLKDVEEEAEVQPQRQKQSHKAVAPHSADD